ncbi:MAG: hypothetical protein WA418_08915 [Bradyrhizobium sp.]
MRPARDPVGKLRPGVGRSAFLLPICHACDVGTSLALVEPHPTDPNFELRTFRCPLCGSQEVYETERRK